MEGGQDPEGNRRVDSSREAGHPFFIWSTTAMGIIGKRQYRLIYLKCNMVQKYKKVLGSFAHLQK